MLRLCNRGEPNNESPSGDDHIKKPRQFKITCFADGPAVRGQSCFVVMGVCGVGDDGFSLAGIEKVSNDFTVRVARQTFTKKNFTRTLVVIEALGAIAQ